MHVLEQVERATSVQGPHLAMDDNACEHEQRVCKHTTHNSPISNHTWMYSLWRESLDLSLDNNKVPSR